MTLQEWRRLAEKRTSGDMVWDILRDWGRQVAWRDCATDPPPAFVSVLLHRQYDSKRLHPYLTIGYRDETGRYHDEVEFDWDIAPLHWMQLPLPPYRELPPEGVKD